MSTIEENKVSQVDKEEILKKVFQLKAKQLKEDKGLFENYQAGWLENLFDFDISCLRELEQWMDSVIEKENSPEITQLWVFYRDMIRFSYYFFTFRWINLAKENYFTLKIEQLYEDFFAYLKEDCTKNELVWGKDNMKYFTQKIQSVYEGDVWQLVDGVTKVAREFKDSSLEWFDYYVNYNARLFPELKKFAFNHAAEVQNYLWTRFSAVLKVWMRQLNTAPLESLDYSFIVIENFFLMNGLVRSSFFEDSKRVVPLQAKQTYLQAQLGWKHVSNKLGYAKDLVAKTVNSALVSQLTVEQSEVLTLRQEGLCSLLKEEYPLRIHKGLNLFVLAYFHYTDNDNEYQARTNKIKKVNSYIEKKLDEVFKRKDKREERIAALQNAQIKSEETVENRQKKIDEEFEKLQKTKTEEYEKSISSIQKELEANKLKKDKVVQEVEEIKRIYNEEYNRQQKQIQEDKLWKEQYDQKMAKINQFDIVKTIVNQFDSKTEAQFQEKAQKIEEENRARIAKEKRDQRKAELEKLEIAYQQEAEKIELLQKQKKRIPKKKPELIALEKQNLEELQQIRLAEEQDKIAEEERKLAEQKAEEEKQLNNVINKFVQQKQENIQAWVMKKGQSMSNIDPVTFIKNTFNSTINTIGETLLWFTPIINTIIYGPLDNFKIVKQLGDKSSVLYKKALFNRTYQEPVKPTVENLGEYFEPKYLDKLNSQSFEVDPLRKGNLIRLLKHNVIGSDTLSLAFFKIVQDKLMQYTSGSYQNYNNIVAGALSGAMMAFLMNPFDCFKTLYVATDLKVQQSIKNIHFRWNIGLSANILSSAVYRGMQFPLYEHFKRTAYLKKYNITEENYEKHTNYQHHDSYNNYLSIGQKYIAAVSASLLSSVVAYPLDTARKVMYTNLYIEDSAKHLKTIRETLQVNNNWYGGFKYNCIKQILQPITFVIWDHAASQFCNKSKVNSYLY